MVSRSLEKMILIAIGLSTVVIIGVPVLMYAIDTITITTYLEDARIAAEEIHLAASVLDDGTYTTQTIVITIPPGFSVGVDNNTLIVRLSYGGQRTQTWTESYNHPLLLDVSLGIVSTRATYGVNLELIDDVIHLSFIQVVPSAD